VDTVEEGKKKNKEELCSRYGLDPAKPLITFIGGWSRTRARICCRRRFEESFYYLGRKMNFFILGSGVAGIEGHLQSIRDMSRGDYNTLSAMMKGSATSSMRGPILS
jgi:starch synthase